MPGSLQLPGANGVAAGGCRGCRFGEHRLREPLSCGHSRDGADGCWCGISLTPEGTLTRITYGPGRVGWPTTTAKRADGRSGMLTISQ
jgi:hypothetical protein